MKKTILKTLAVATIVGMMSPLTVNAAAKISSNPEAEMNVGDLINVTITTQVPVESMQFDLNFDASKYVYEGIKTELDNAGSNLIDDKSVVRVSAYDEDGDKTNTVTLRFRATSAGETSSFSIKSGRTIELGDDEDSFENDNDMRIDSITIIGQADEEGNQWWKDYNYNYLGEDGEKITTLPKTNANVAIGKFSKLGTLTNVLPYALSDSDDRVTITDIKEEFGEDVVTSVTDIAKTGDTIQIDGKEYTIIIYGDINGDGKVSTLDVLKTYKEKNTLTDLQKEAADIQNDGIVNDDDVNAMHAFILEQEGFIINNPNRTTIIDKNPVKTIEKDDIEITSLIDPNTTKYTYSKVPVATITAKNGATLTRELLQATELKAEGAASGVGLSFDVATDGKTATIYVTTTSSVSYAITPVIKGTDVEDGEIRGSEIKFTAHVNKAITNVRLYDETGTLIDNDTTIELESLASKRIAIIFYYTDHDQNGNAIEQELFNVTTATASMDIIDSTNCLKDTTGFNDENEGGIANDTQAIRSILIQSYALDTDETAQLKITVDNTSYGVKDYTRTLNIAVKKTVIQTGLKIDGKDAENGAINLYHNATPSTNDTRAKQVADLTGTFTVLAIADDKGLPMRTNNIIADVGEADASADAPGNILFSDYNGGFSCWNIDVYPLYYDKDTDKYYNGSAMETCSYIGIRISGNYDPTDEEIEKVYIKYYDASGNAKTITLDVTVDPVTTRSADDSGIAPASLDDDEITVNKKKTTVTVDGTYQEEDSDIEQSEEQLDNTSSDETDSFNTTENTQSMQTVPANENNTTMNSVTSKENTIGN